MAAIGRVLTVLLVHAEGEVPEQRGVGFQGGDIQIATATVAGIQPDESKLGLITPAQISQGRFLRGGQQGQPTPPAGQRRCAKKKTARARRKCRKKAHGG